MTESEPVEPSGSRLYGSLHFARTSGLWSATVDLPKVDGKRRRKTVRSKDEAVAREALRVMSEQVAADRLARKLAAAREAVAAKDLPWTVSTWSAHWLELIASRRIKPMTYTAYESAIRLHVNPVIGSVPLTAVGPAHLRQVETTMLARGLSSSSALHTHRVLAVCFGDAVREEMLERNPAERMRPPLKAPASLSALSTSDAVRVFHELSSRPDGALWATSLLTGARRGEVLGLELSRVGEVLELSWQLQRFPWVHGCSGDPCSAGRRATDCPGRHIDLPASFERRHVYGSLYLTRPKSVAGVRFVPLVEPLRAILLTHIRRNPIPRNGLVFVNAVGNPIDPDWMSNRWKTLRKELGITSAVRLHDLRHAAVDMLYEAGVPEDAIVEMLGHSNNRMTRSYKSGPSMTRLRTAMEQVSALYEAPSR
ncbi:MULTISPECIES: site-specific integrase [unclassified Rathayibacter]|uniref:tyrosine-type recombinase/integrase n=1 Tax=unclassified Rathayibacter TaxID=2609250 RepID=UPI0010466501|nr:MULTISPECIES: site-specific integrase [unclassified Rathayibacter]